MAGPVLSQAEIDNLLSSMKAPEAASDRPDAVVHDYRTPKKFPADFTQEMTEIHGIFRRVLAERLSRELRVSVTVDQVGAEQLTYEGYTRSMPNPNILVVLTLDPLPGNVVLEVSPQLALVLVDRLLGGPGRPIAPRPPTPLEENILRQLLAHPMAGMREAFNGVLDVEPTFVTAEMNPQFTHAADPTEMVFTMTFSVTAEAVGPTTRGLVTLCYPLTLINPLQEAIRLNRLTGTSTQSADTSLMENVISRSLVDLAVRTRPTAVAAADLVGLQVGDVVALSHMVNEPLIGTIQDEPVIACDVGRAGPYLAARIRSWT